ncbi:MAG: hypothetical protein ABS43_06045 [Bordetella sp. SCN 67-23]|nr:LysR family transcriptional regulator [Burkholderiales bacterium]ODS75360.1 MAG: hypothetical protein ABS43_06045 [Bordetella sp. SCN 67-23]OJW88690.1 MAG: hypothetical protein BGO71_04440 [Burkholderiales bacterium 67-32]
MDIRQIRYFVTVAEELSFTRAAEKLHISQPPLSQHIKSLEEELGIELLFRNRREVKLTDAGRVFLLEARKVLEHLNVAVNSTLRTARGDTGVLRLGMATSAAFNVMPDVIDRIRTRFPQVEILVSDVESKEQIRMIAEERLDIGFVHAAPLVRGMCSTPLFSEPYAAVVREDDALAGLATLTMADLAGRPLIAFSPAHAPSLADSLVTACLAAGFNPQIAHTARHPFTMLQMVGMGLGIALVPASFARTHFPGVRFVHVDDTSRQVTINAVWLERTASTLVRRIVAEVLDHDGVSAQRQTTSRQSERRPTRRTPA